MNTLHIFYQTKLGRLIQHRIERHIVRRWSNLGYHKKVLGVGYTLPFLPRFPHACHALLEPHPFEGEKAANVFASSPSILPLRNESMDALFLIHVLEHYAHTTIPNIMREAWRVLKFNGRICIVIPNAMSAWSMWPKCATLSHIDIIHSLQLCLFTPTVTSGLFLVPPVLGPVTDSINWMGTYFMPYFGSLLFVEASKRLAPKHGLFIKKILARHDGERILSRP